MRENVKIKQKESLEMKKPITEMKKYTRGMQRQI